MARKRSRLSRFLRAAVFALTAGAIAIFVLIRFFGLRVELSGTGMTPLFTFYDPEAHFEAIERDRRSATSPEVVLAAHRGGEAASAYWSDFRGPGRTGVYLQTPIRVEWPAEGLPELWRQKIGGGYASMVVAQGLVFTIEQRRADEVVAAYDFATGKQVWENSWPAYFQEQLGGDGPRATPVWDQGKLYALGAEGELRCLDAATGRVRWNRNILDDNGAQNLEWGMAAAPLIEGEMVIVLPGGRDGRSVVAYQKETGEPIWRAQSDKQAYVSPIAVELAGRRQLIVLSAERLMGLSLEDGSLYWDYPWTTSYDINAAQPILVDADRLFISSGYGHGAALLKIVPDGDGFRAEKVWERNSMKNKFNSSVLYKGHVYGLDEAILACVEVSTGRRVWKGGRYGYGQLLLAGDRLVVLTETGDVVLVKATPESHQELARFSALKGKTWSVPAIADAKLLVRNQTEMAVYDLAP